MAEISKLVSCEELGEVRSPGKVSWEELGGLAGEEEEEEERIKVSYLQGELQSMSGAPDFVLDMESLPLVASTADSDAIVDPRSPLQKSLSRKGSQRSERKAAPGSSFPHASYGSYKGSALAGPAATSESTVIVFPSSAGAAETNGVARATTAAASRRCHVGKRAPWLNPRKVLLFFATMSSMGTIILLYFTLLMSKMDGGDVNA